MNRHSFRILVVFAVAVLSLTACDGILTMLNRDQLVAKVGKQKLYKSDIENFIPLGLPEADSISLVHKYVNSWASEILFAEMAQKNLSKADLDVTAELEEYRNALLKYRYQEQYIAERLDTFILESQIRDYYKSHEDVFTLDRPVVKAIYIDIVGNASSYQTPDDIDSLAVASSLRYFDFSEKWIDATILAREFGMDCKTMLSLIKDNVIRYNQEGQADEKIAFIFELQTSGTAPLDYCKESIRDILLNQRKRALNADLEQDLLNDALNKKQLVIY